MQFGRKKDWPHGKLKLENNIENRKNIFSSERLQMHLPKD